MKRATLALLLIACGGTHTTGTIAQRAFNGSQTWGTFSNSELVLNIEENVNRCGGQNGPATRYRLIARLSEWNGTNIIPASKTGVYTVMPKYCRDNAGQLYSDCSVGAKPAPAGSFYVNAEYQRDGEQTALPVLSGSFTLDVINAQKPGSAEGSFSVFIDPADKMSGTFSGTICDVTE
jgi:hypothetical protein